MVLSHMCTPISPTMASFHLLFSRIYLLALFIVFNAQSISAQLPNFRTCSADIHHSPLSKNYELSICPLPIDEESAAETGTWAPWKRRPYCVEPFMRDDDITGPEFCLYTFESFRGDQSLSVVTTPALAATIVDALDDTFLPSKLRDHLSSSLMAEAHRDPAFTVEEVPGKGKGLTARHPIRKWDVVLMDHPAILAHTDLFDVVGSEVRQDLLERALKLLPEKQQEEVLSLARSTGGEPIEDILKTNIFGVELGVEIPHLGIFPLASRINHDCRPNVFWRYSIRTLTVQVIAMRDIKVGDEITQSYVPLGLSYSDREEDLNHWGFRCTCSLCASSKRQRAVSDQHREQLQDIYFTLNEGAIGRSNITVTSIGSLVDEMESLVREEGLEAQLLVYYGVIARAYMRVGELAAARRYVDLCEDLWVRYAGDEDDYLAGMQQLRHELDEREKKAQSSKESHYEP
ncbi:SET domain-containing protein [Jackrogersella minutella]|nr:SET domain-containing protein [Jackrogersella minutella]